MGDNHWGAEEAISAPQRSDWRELQAAMSCSGCDDVTLPWPSWRPRLAHRKIRSRKADCCRGPARDRTRRAARNFSLRPANWAARALAGTQGCLAVHKVALELPGQRPLIRDSLARSLVMAGRSKLAQADLIKTALGGARAHLRRLLPGRTRRLASSAGAPPWALALCGRLANRGAIKIPAQF